VRRRAAGIPLPERYRRFLGSEEHARFSMLHMERGYLVGSFRLDFTTDALRDSRKLGEMQGIELLMDGELDWHREYPRFLPLSTLIDPDLDDPCADQSVVVKSFLVIDIRDPACPVSIWDYDDCRFFPLADSLDDFLAGRSARQADRFPAQFRLS
jgi:hypothetical protein